MPDLVGIWGLPCSDSLTPRFGGAAGMAQATSSIFAPFKMVICGHTCAFTESPSGAGSIEAVVNQIRRWPTPNVVVASQHRASEMLKQVRAETTGHVLCTGYWHLLFSCSNC
jgi:hypothetical protein